MTHPTNTPAPDLVAEIRSIVRLLEAGEWAHTFPQTDLGQRLDDAITRLHNAVAAVSAAPVAQEPVAHMTVINAGAVMYRVAPAASALPPGEYDLYAAPVGAVLPGYRLVPEEPTLQMILRGAVQSGLHDGEPLHIYRAMLAAAPTPPAAPAVPPLGSMTSPHVSAGGPGQPIPMPASVAGSQEAPSDETLRLAAAAGVWVPLSGPERDEVLEKLCRLIALARGARPAASVEPSPDIVTLAREGMDVHGDIPESPEYRVCAEIVRPAADAPWQSIAELLHARGYVQHEGDVGRVAHLLAQQLGGQAQQDAARYRWIAKQKDAWDVLGSAYNLPSEEHGCKNLTESIDAARQGQGDSNG